MWEAGLGKPAARSGKMPAFVQTLNDILAGKYDTDYGKIGAFLDKASEYAEAENRLDEYDALLNKAADHLTAILKKKAGIAE